ncbi:MAG: phosphoglucosamine mutase [Alphaproteobacteria bacterium]|nr:MAG: phosphoglucosamine mutase [Alphaproteobacteria bacterium]
MANKLFGTDGIRGTANREPMTPATILRVAMAAAIHVRRQQPTEGAQRHPLVVIAKDTRLSGYMVEGALESGFVAMGMNVRLVGPLPTPALAMLTRSLRADMGVMISASHNPYEDNGIKIFGADGYKLSDETERAIEAMVADYDFNQDLATDGRMGQAQRVDDASGRYVEYVKATFPRHLRLDGLRVVLDCAHGAAYRVAPQVLWELGADVVPMAVNPDGMNINRNCGATAPAALCEAVVTHGADIGIALDGDADRLILVDEKGRVIDGDQIMALVATALAKSGQLKGGGAVATVMSNLGLERHLEQNGLRLVRTPVGDRHVMERMRKDGFNFGGEQSGHLIFTDHGTTGDGLMAALQVLAVLRESGEKASKLLRVFPPVPQKLRNVRVASTAVLQTASAQEAIRQAEDALCAQGGRLLVRASGTEPLIRVMAEGDNAALVEETVSALCLYLGQGAKAA